MAANGIDTLHINGQPIPDLGPYLYVMEDSTPTLTAEEMFVHFVRNGVPAYGSSYLNFGYSKSGFWIFLTVKNDTRKPQHLYYYAANPHLNRILLFCEKDGKIFAEENTGDLMPFDQREISHKDFVLDFTLQPQETQTLMLRVDNRGYTTMLPLTLLYPADYDKNMQQDYLLWGIVSGILLFVSVFSFFMFVSLRDRLYLFYGLYALTTLLYVWCNNGLGYQYLWSDYPMVASRIRLILGSINGALILHNMQLFVSQSSKNSRFYVPVLVVKFLLVGITLLMFIPYDFTQDLQLIKVSLIISDVIFLAAIVLMFATLTEKIRQGKMVALYYMIAVIFFVGGTILMLMVRLKVMEPSYVTVNGIYAGILAEIVILTFALTRRYNIHTREREALKEEIREKEKMEAINLALAQERERKRIAADMHDDLGASLSSLRLMSELSTRKNTVEELRDDTMNISRSAEELTFKIREIVWTLDNENDNLENLLLYIQKYGNRFFAGSPIKFEMELPLYIPYHHFSGENRRHIYLAVKEIFNNALKHSQADTVRCDISIDGRLHIRIADNGTGFDTRQNTSGHGLKNIRNRMEALGGKCEITSSEQGTKIGLEIILNVEC